MADFFRDVYDATIFGQAAAAREERELRRAELKKQKETDQRIKLLEAQRKIRPLIDDAYTNLINDPQQLGKALDDIFAAYSFETGQQVDKDLAKALKDPKFGPSILAESEKAGVTLGQLFQEGQQPLLRAQARIALGAQGQRTERNRLLAPTAEPATAAAPAAVPTAPSTIPATPAPVTVPAPSSALAPHVEAIDAQIAQLEARRAGALRFNATPQQLAPLDQQLKDLRERRAKLVEGPALAGVEAGVKRREEPTPTEIQRETGALTRGAHEDLATRPEAGRLLTPAELESQRQAAQEAEREAGGLRKTIREQAEGSRQAIPKFQRIAALLETAGRTGRAIGPLRKGIGQALQLALPDNVVNRLMKLPDIELLEQANTELAIAGLKAVGGNDTERELLTLMQTNPGLMRTKQANQFATRWALASHEQNLYRDQLADKWIEDRRGEGKPSSLRSRDRWGKSFSQRWDEYMLNFPLFARVSRDLGVDPVEFAASMGYNREKAQRAFGGR